MGHSVQIWVGVSLGRSCFWLSDVLGWVGLGRFGLGRVNFGSGQPIFGPRRLPCKNKQLFRKFRVWDGLVRVNSSFGSIFG